MKIYLEKSPSPTIAGDVSYWGVNNNGLYYWEAQDCTTDLEAFNKMVKKYSNKPLEKIFYTSPNQYEAHKKRNIRNFGPGYYSTEILIECDTKDLSSVTTIKSNLEKEIYKLTKKIDKLKQQLDALK